MLSLAIPTGVGQPTPTFNPLNIIDIEQICTLLGVSRSWVETQIRKDKTFPKTFRIGARRYAKFVDLQGWVDARARAA